MDRDDAQLKPVPRDRKEMARRIGAGIVAALVIAFAVLNRQDVDVDWILGTWSTPLILVIAISFLLGGAGGFLLRGRRAARKR